MISAVGNRPWSVPQRDTATTVVLVHGDVEVARWPLVRGGRPDLAVVDELARLQLAAGRLGCSIRLRDTCGALTELLDLAGLADIVTVAVVGATRRGEEGAPGHAADRAGDGNDGDEALDDPTNSDGDS